MAGYSARAVLLEAELLKRGGRGHGSTLVRALMCIHVHVKRDRGGYLRPGARPVHDSGPIASAMQQEALQLRQQLLQQSP